VAGADGTPGYLYEIDGGGFAASATFGSLAAGGYTVTVQDANLCTFDIPVTITQPDALTGSITAQTPTTCNGDSDGSVTVAGADGTAGYLYSTDGGTTTQISGTFAGLAAGGLTVTVVDANNCTFDVPVTITQPDALVGSLDGTTDATCGASNGDATVSAAGGNGGNEYSIDGGTNFQASGTFSGLAPGSYTIIVEDDNGCQDNIPITINDLSGITASITDQTNVDCNGNSTGEVEVTAGGSTGPYTYADDGATFTAVNTFTGLAAGSYTITARDANGCEFPVAVTITEPSTVDGSITAQTNVLCNGNSTGSVTVAGADGTPGYLYEIDGGGFAASATFGSLAAGGYTVTVQDANLCTFDIPVTITQPDALTGSITAQTNVDCNGNSTGEVTVTGADGTAGYLYSTDGGTTTQISGTFSNLAVGGLTITVVDVNSCTFDVPVTITEPTVLALTPSGTDANCGQADGEVCVVATGGTSATDYSYAWNDAGSQTTACASNIIAGSYDVVVTDDNNCTQTTSFTINDIAGPSSNASVVSNASGFGICDGELTVAVTDGSGTFSYAWDDGATQTTQNATALCAGTYCVTVTDDITGCTTQDCATIAEPGAIVLDITPTHLLCNGVCIGEADATVSGGVGPYIFSWSNGGTVEDLTGLCAGDYTLTVVDDNGVTTSETVTINEPSAISIDVLTGTDVTCNAACDGTLDVNASGGTGTLVYSWDGGLANGQNLTAVCAGTYNVTVTDDNLCSATSPYTINEPTPLVLTPSNTDANCGQANGEACVTISGGTSGYTQVWNDPAGSTTLCAPNVISGTYNVTVTDNNNCVETLAVTVNDVTGGSAAITVDNNVLCNAACDAEATVNMTGGNGPFTYVWDSGAAINSQTNSGICAGAISVTVTDSDGCATTATETVTEPTVLTVNSTPTPTTCFGGSDGEVTTTASGGTALVGYQYNWIDQATTLSVGNTATVTGLPIGTYCVTVTDDNNCTATECVTITQPDDIVATTTNVDANCGQADGSVSVTNRSGGSGFYNADTWVDVNGDPVANINAVPAGAYTVTITDNAGCTGTAVATVSDLAGPTAIIVAQTDALCNDSCNGTANIAISGGVAPYVNVWSPAPGSGQGTDNISGLCQGTYSLAVTDDNGCATNVAVVIGQPAPVVSSITSTLDASGAGLCDGEAVVNATGGDNNFTYSWFDDCTATTPNGTLTGTNVNGLCAEDYGLVATDGNGCADTICVVISEPDAITSILSGQDAACNGECNGQATVVASGGITPYTYEWMSVATGNPIGQTGTTANALCAGDYFVVVTDANGIDFNSDTYTIGQPDPITGNTNVTSNYNGYDVSCESNCDGAAQVTANGGTLPYSYLWDVNAASQTTDIASNLCATSYNVTVTDDNGCNETFNVTLAKPPVLINSFTETDVTCNAACDGRITANTSGGNAPYTYLWDDPALTTIETAADLCAGTYNVIIEDNNGCVLNQSASVTEPIALVLSTSMTGSNCNQDDGSATVGVVSGVPGYTYAWDANAGNQTTATATNLFAGCYDVTVTDGNGCTTTVNVCVVDLGAPSASILTHTDLLCNKVCDGFAQIQITGGTPPLNYNWYDNNNNPIGQTTASATNLCAGTYNFLVQEK